MTAHGSGKVDSLYSLTFNRFFTFVFTRSVKLLRIAAIITTYQVKSFFSRAYTT